ncbi:unnamed protein product [Peniophora sp. CBMAI 1063]|nr:unnamed protein product [Peniophora sp. CBMAI 1063]
MSAERPDPAYDASADYPMQLNNYLGRTGQQESFRWDTAQEGPTAYPKHRAYAILNEKIIGQAQGNSKRIAKKVAAFWALRSLGQV